VEIVRRLPVPIGEVFRWWTEADLLEEWMSPIGIVDAESDLRVGGALRIVMKSGDTVIEHVGRYLEIERPTRLVFTWQSPYTGTQPSIVTVELEADGDGATRLRLVHSELPAAAAESHGQGWGSMLDRLAGRVLEAGGARGSRRDDG
jgi:uncharacterized protein YndB with AHSA1/START domain